LGLRNRQPRLWRDERELGVEDAGESLTDTMTHDQLVELLMLRRGLVPHHGGPLAISKPGGYHTRTLEEVRQYEDKHPVGTKARLALAIFMFTGVRRSDAVKLGLIVAPE
jgi:hypothetical protein